MWPVESTAQQRKQTEMKVMERSAGGGRGRLNDTVSVYPLCCFYEPGKEAGGHIWKHPCCGGGGGDADGYSLLTGAEMIASPAPPTFLMILAIAHYTSRNLEMMIITQVWRQTRRIVSVFSVAASFLLQICSFRTRGMIDFNMSTSLHINTHTHTHTQFVHVGCKKHQQGVWPQAQL